MSDKKEATSVISIEHKFLQKDFEKDMSFIREILKDHIECMVAAKSVLELKLRVGGERLASGNFCSEALCRRLCPHHWHGCGCPEGLGRLGRDQEIDHHACLGQEPQFQASSATDAGGGPFFPWLTKLHTANGSPNVGWVPPCKNFIIGVHIGAVRFLPLEKGDFVVSLLMGKHKVQISTKEDIKFCGIGQQWVVQNNWSVEAAKLFRGETDESFNISKKFKKYIGKFEQALPCESKQYSLALACHLFYFISYHLVYC